MFNVFLKFPANISHCHECHAVTMRVTRDTWHPGLIVRPSLQTTRSHRQERVNIVTSDQVTIVTLPAWRSWVTRGDEDVTPCRGLTMIGPGPSLEDVRGVTRLMTSALNSNDSIARVWTRALIVAAAGSKHVGLVTSITLGHHEAVVKQFYNSSLTSLQSNSSLSMPSRNINIVQCIISSQWFFIIQTRPDKMPCLTI